MWSADVVILTRVFERIVKYDKRFFISNVYLIAVCNKKNTSFIGHDLNKLFLNLNTIFFIFGDLSVTLTPIRENINLLWVAEFFPNSFIQRFKVNISGIET